MKNGYEISSICRQIKNFAKSTESLAFGIQETEDHASELSKVYFDMLLGELENIQRATIELTKLIVGSTAEKNAGGDGGDLDTAIGDSPVSDPAATKEGGK